MTKLSSTPDPLDLLIEWARAGLPCALATVTSTWGSSPRPAGSMMAVCENGRIEGSVSGGCVEGAVIGEAATVMQTGRPAALSYGVSSDDAWTVGLACGGLLDVYVAAISTPTHPQGTLPLSMLETVAEKRRARMPVIMATELATGTCRLLYDTAPATSAPPTDLETRLAARAREVFETGRSLRLEDEAGQATWFLHLVPMPPRLLIVGAVHIAQVLAPMAQGTGFSVTVIDPRTQLATPERFPGITLDTDWPDEALERLGIDNQTAIVTLTHDAKLDDPTLQFALGSEAFYIGALGSRKTQASRVGRLQETGFGSGQIARIHGPVGLAIGAVGAAEIALSILAEIVAVRHNKPLGRVSGWA
ncbi:xanthine dehydrogenase [Komagataeibacter nataicola]|uniref:Xanthine dehydrogenase n=1 Tax=Komagataeibacter nataicola TaxID=265960 RepID=A0A9N7H3A4_9PROT|nr:XdhC/CoxI family protein [Komagataeibacter nataicola]AQU88023.1 xanthine dehydrogenase [Komagataeibacter nataicola]PYD65932.1 xanthine dehydrogenase [Komagataeibacter nataicola]WEQ55081.1 XdhC family protein [Komagataeibacter nataicola]GBR18292.1 xanthine dehydrogenase accessory factor XdhC/CoxI [Komagataeibacter nataicola NRIC 0616]